MVTQYLHSKGSKDSPIICFQGLNSPWAKIYDEFSYIWRDSQDLFL